MAKSYQIYHLVIRGLLTKLTNFAFLQIANFGHFDIFMDGWVGVVKFNIKDHLSPAKAEVEGWAWQKCIHKLSGKVKQ